MHFIVSLQADTLGMYYRGTRSENNFKLVPECVTGIIILISWSTLVSMTSCMHSVNVDIMICFEALIGA